MISVSLLWAISVSFDCLLLLDEPQPHETSKSTTSKVAAANRTRKSSLNSVRELKLTLVRLQILSMPSSVIKIRAVVEIRANALLQLELFDARTIFRSTFPFLKVGPKSRATARRPVQPCSPQCSWSASQQRVNRCQICLPIKI